MPRIPDELIERIKTEIPIVRLAERAGVVELKVHGENLVGFCVFHVDKNTPNLVLTPAKNVFHCFACGEAGSPIDWVMRIEGVRFRAAVEILLLEYFPMEARTVGVGVPPKHSTVPKLPSPIEPEASEEEVAQGVVRYYRERLKESPDALAFLEKRGIATADVIERFQLGFSDRTLGLRLPLMNRKAGRAIRTILQKLGYYRETEREHFVGCVTIPFFNVAGNVAGMYGRRIQAHLPKSAVKHLYTPGEHRGLLNREAFETSKEIILCEAPIDALTFFRWDFHNVTTTFGAKVFTDELLDAFVTHGTERCFIAFDRDEAGDDGARKAAEKLMARGVECFRVLFPKGMDANEYALKVQPGDKSLGVLLRGADWMGSGTMPPSPVREARFEAAPATKETAFSAPLSLAAGHETGRATKEENGSKAAREAGSEAPEASRIERSTQADAASGAVSSTTERGGEEPEASADAGADSSVQADSSAPASVAMHASTATPVTTPEPAAPATASSVVAGVELCGDDEAVFRFEDRSYRVRGLKKALQSGSLHVTVKAQREGAFFDSNSPISGTFLDRFDFVSSMARSRFEKQAAHEMGVKPDVVKWDLGQVVRSLEELQEKARLEALKPRSAAPEMSDEDRAEGLEYASAEDLVERILRDYDKGGTVGEKINALAGYLGAVSRLSDRPLAIIIRSSSAAGKSALMDAILRFIPKESKEKYSALSGHALFYFEGKDFKHKVLAIVEEEGAQKASYALKLLQSEGEITIASTGKDAGTGRLITKEYRVEGPVMIFLSSTDIDIDDELLNRAIVLTVDEGREQTRAIHRLQRESQTLEGLWAKEEREEIYRAHHNLQRLLRPLPVVNPFVRELTFLDDRTRTRRDHTKYLGLIEAITLLHQYQRPRKTDTRGGKMKEYVEVDLFDVALANRIAADVLGRSLDELGPQTRRLLLLLDEMVRAVSEIQAVDRSDVRFTLRDARAFTGWSHDQLWRHMQRLTALEYAIVHRGGRGQTFVYELLYDGQGKDGTPFLIGLADVEALAKAHGLPVPKPVLPPLPRHGTVNDEPTIPTSAGKSETSAGVSRVHLGAFWVGSAEGRRSARPAPGAAPGDNEPESPENSHLEAERGQPQMYTQGSRNDSSANGHRSRDTRPRVNLLRFPPIVRNAAEPDPPVNDGGDRSSYRKLLMRRVRSGF